MPILKLIPACKDYIWGGTKLITDYHKDFSGERLAETWELSCHPDGPSVIANGTFAGRTLREYIADKGFRVLGSNCQIFQEFPILIKFIDARDNLSIQVHPNNMDALADEHQYGKTEMWYILEAGPDAFIYYGFKREIGKAEFLERIRNGTLLEVLNAVPVHRGDVFYIPHLQGYRHRGNPAEFKRHLPRFRLRSYRRGRKAPPATHRTGAESDPMPPAPQRIQLWRASGAKPLFYRGYCGCSLAGRL